MDSSKQNRQLAVVERLGAFAWNWLGGRDSNPDKQSQSLLSYRWTTSQCQSRCDNRGGNYRL
jgi:hypothetical protein